MAFGPTLRPSGKDRRNAVACGLLGYISRSSSRNVTTTNIVDSFSLPNSTPQELSGRAKRRGIEMHRRGPSPPQIVSCESTDTMNCRSRYFRALSAPKGLKYTSHTTRNTFILSAAPENEKHHGVAIWCLLAWRERKGVCGRIYKKNSRTSAVSSTNLGSKKLYA